MVQLGWQGLSVKVTLIPWILHEAIHQQGKFNPRNVQQLECEVSPRTGLKIDGNIDRKPGDCRTDPKSFPEVERRKLAAVAEPEKESQGLECDLYQQRR